VTRLFVLALDGGDDRVLLELLEAGRLPTLASLRERGAHVAFDSQADLLPESVWPTLVSGRRLGEHEVFHFYKFEPESMGLRFRRETDVETDPFWLHLPGRGEGTLVADVPELHVHPESAADEACCWHAHAPPHAPHFTSRELERVLRASGAPPTLADPDYSLPPSRERDAAVADHLARSAAFRARALGAAAWGRRAVFAVFHELHNAVHALGHHYDPEHWYRPFAPEPELLFRVYEAVDAALGALVEEFGDANVAVLVARGIRPTDTGGDLLEELFARAGLLTVAGAGRAGGKGGSVPVAERLRRLVPGDVRRRLAGRLLPQRLQHELASRAFRERYAWPATRVFPLPTWTIGLVRANVAGREAAGVLPRDQLDPVLQEAGRLITETRNATTGTPLARRVIRVEHESERDPRPDLIVEWFPGPPARTASHPRLGTWELDRRHGHAWSHHRGRALAFLAGPGVRAVPEAFEGDLLGVAPTLLALAGVRRANGSAPWTDVLAG